MDKRSLVILPNPILRRISRPIEKIDSEIMNLIDNMFEVMYSAEGIGLAAVQIGVLYRVIVIDLQDCADNGGAMVLINPTILSRSDGFSVYQEGCLSIPDYRADVKRASFITVRYMDRNAQPNIIYADGLLATCLQHEIDHLNGVLFIDHISRLKRDMVINKFSKLAK
ncbi:peptide deformylase [Candidatus Liberibacter africanus]|uniref:Peptide deformylase n=1 Tax=Candidatus Liberibacter africanus PTSAPSY TaxID=1277257 RepID=A0A0G3I1V8_LIBAF|nr:peptide deformylase [Candidatus Liberibacter africanus]AKK19866.1 peptide deformylase [Candidatus Liberibacter africanus PTSAPSY]QTP63722.1 peptide deformylase [Candidatus Liberibacter africanus]